MMILLQFIHLKYLINVILFKNHFMDLFFNINLHLKFNFIMIIVIKHIIIIFKYYDYHYD